MRTDSRRPRAAPLRFLLAAGAIVAAYFVASTTSLFEERLLPGHLEANARAAASLLRFCRVDAAASGAQIGLEGFRLDVVRGCDALDPAAFLAAAILAFPAPLRRKLAGVAAGTFAIVALNVVRIAALSFAGSRWPAAVEALHVEVFQVGFILAVFLLWIGWARWAGGDPAIARRA